MQQPAPEADVALPVVWRLERARLSGQPLPAVPGALWPAPCRPRGTATPSAGWLLATALQAGAAEGGM